MRVVVIILLLACILGYGQMNFSRYLDESFVPTINPEDYEDVDFRWDMSGKTQTFMNEGLLQLKEDNYNVAAENFKEVIVPIGETP